MVIFKNKGNKLTSQEGKDILITIKLLTANYPRYYTNIT